MIECQRIRVQDPHGGEHENRKSGRDGAGAVAEGLNLIHYLEAARGN